MRKRTVTLDELRDSTLLYKKDLPAFGYLILLTIFLLIVAVSIWGAKTTKPYIVKGSGMVESPNKNYVMSSVSGEITKIGIREGSLVNKGDALFSVKSVDADVQMKQLDNQKKILEKEISKYRILVESIKDDVNYFSSSDSEDSLFHSRFEEYKSLINQQVIDTKTLKDYGYSNSQIEEEIKKNDNKKSEIYYSAIREAESTKEQLQTELNNLNAQSNAISSGNEAYTVKANADGTIHMLGDYKEGMVIQAGNPIASISTENDKFYITANINAADRTRIEEGNSASIELVGLQQNMYGTITGEIYEIDSDVSMTEDGKAFFNIKIMPEKYYLLNKDGKKVNLSPGLQADVRITYEEITYAKYLLDALGIRD